MNHFSKEQTAQARSVNIFTALPDQQSWKPIGNGAYVKGNIKIKGNRYYYMNTPRDRGHDNIDFFQKEHGMSFPKAVRHLLSFLQADGQQTIPSTPAPTTSPKGFLPELTPEQEKSLIASLQREGVMDESMARYLLSKKWMSVDATGHIILAHIDFETKAVVGATSCTKTGFLLEQAPNSSGAFHLSKGRPNVMVVCSDLHSLLFYLEQYDTDDKCFLLARDVHQLEPAMKHYGEQILRVEIFDCLAQKFVSDIMDAYNNVDSVYPGWNGELSCA